MKKAEQKVAQPAAAKTRIVKVKKDEASFSQRAQFVSAKGARLDIVVKSTTKGFVVMALLKKAPKAKGEKVKSERGMVSVLATQPEALKKFDEMKAAAFKNGWQGKQTVTKETFSQMPNAAEV